MFHDTNTYMARIEEALYMKAARSSTEEMACAVGTLSVTNNLFAIFLMSFVAVRSILVIS